MMPEIEYASSREVRDAIASLDRTEDVRFSPDNRRLAIAAFARNQIVIFDVEICSSPRGIQVALTGGVQMRSAALNEPHGVDFLDDDTIIVASRGGNVARFMVPESSPDVHPINVAPSEVWSVQPSTLVNTPSTVAVTRRERGVSEILICDHGTHSVTRHVLDSGAGVVKRDVLLRKLLSLPDGAAISPDRRWIAVSNHATRSVLVYENSANLSAESDPVGILRRVYAPHGLRFSAEGQHLLVADAEAPHILVYTSEHNDWSGVRTPTGTVTIMNDETFRRGYEPGQGGPKGIDIDTRSRVVVLTSKFQPIAFFDLPPLLQQSSATNDAGERAAEDLAFELRLLGDHRQFTALAESHAQVHTALAESYAAAHSVTAQVHYMTNSRSWRITAPLRRLDSVFRRRS